MSISEIVLIGIHLGCYGKEHDGKLTLFDAVEAALSVEGLQRLRLGSLESVEVEARLLNLMEKDKRLCRQLHLPLQAGCDTTLARMHRPYDTRRFTELLADIRKRIPDIAITTDIIAGFPGETEEEFASTLVFAENCGFSKMHIFPYSKRKGTPAEKMPNQIPETVKQRRCAQLAELDHKQQQKFLERFVGSAVEVLFEQTVEDGYIEGLTSNYLRVYVRSEAELCGKIRKVRLLKAETSFLIGELLKE